MNFTIPKGLQHSKRAKTQMGKNTERRRENKSQSTFQFIFARYSNYHHRLQITQAHFFSMGTYGFQGVYRAPSSEFRNSYMYLESFEESSICVYLKNEYELFTRPRVVGTQATFLSILTYMYNVYFREQKDDCSRVKFL